MRDKMKAPLAQEQAGVRTPLEEGGTALGEVVCSRIVATGVAAEVTRDVQRAGYPAASSDLLRGLQQRAVSEVDAAAALPLDPDKAHSDRWALDELAWLSDRRASAQAEVDATARLRQAAIEALGAYPPPWTVGKRAMIMTTLVFATVLCAGAVAFLIAPSVDTFLCRSYVLSTLGDGAEQWSAAAAFGLSLISTFALLLPQTLVLLLAWGRLRRGVKALFVSADVLFSVMLALVRAGEVWSFQSLSISGYELSLLLAHAAVLLGAAPWIARDAERAEPVQGAQARLMTTIRLHAEAQSALNEIERTLELQRLPLRIREDAARRVPAHKELVAASALSEYLVATAELVEREAQGSAAANEHLERLIDGHLVRAFQERTPAGRRQR